MICDDPKYNNKYQTSTFFFFEFFIFYFLNFFCAEQPKLGECHTSIVQSKEPQTFHPKLSPLKESWIKAYRWNEGCDRPNL